MQYEDNISIKVQNKGHLNNKSLKIRHKFQNALVNVKHHKVLIAFVSRVAWYLKIKVYKTNR